MTPRSQGRKEEVEGQVPSKDMTQIGRAQERKTIGRKPEELVNQAWVPRENCHRPSHDQSDFAALLDNGGGLISA